MNCIKLAVIAGGALIATPAFAQGPTEGEAGAGAEAGAEAGATVEAGAGAEAGTTDPAAASTPSITATASLWSRIMIDRPYVLNAGKVAAYGSYGVVRLSFTEPISGMTVSATGDGFGVGGAYGITDKITAGAQYGFTPGIIGDGDFEIKGPLDLFGEFQLVHDAKMSITASADFEIDLCGGIDTMGDCVSSKTIHAGLGARYNIAPNMGVFTGAPYGPGPVGQHLSINLETDGPITFDIPVGFMFQATPELNIHAMTALANIAISNSDTIVFGADYIPLSVGALFSVTPNIDVTGMFTLPDLKEAQFDLYAFAIGARWYN